jgi:Pvc16 N-terminal domain
MASFEAIGAVGKSIERLLSAAFLEAPTPASGTTKAVLVRTEDLDSDAALIAPPALSIFLYRIAPNVTMRSAWSGVASVDGVARLPLDLHFLLTPWADDAEVEQRILGRAIQCLESISILSGPLLYPAATWAPNEAVQVVLEELPVESIMRTFDKLPIDYKLSVPYVARVVRIDARTAVIAPDVTTSIRGLTPTAVRPMLSLADS